MSGRANRILILVPESLVHQWFVEMLRRFNVWMHIFDVERCASIEAGEPSANPFLDDQLVLTSIDFLASDPRRAELAVSAGWDMFVVDEAHHLEWSEGEPSRRHSGRVGRSAAGRAYDVSAVALAVVAHIRHTHTDYDELLRRGTERLAARMLVREKIEQVRLKWSGG